MLFSVFELFEKHYFQYTSKRTNSYVRTYKRTENTFNDAQRVLFPNIFLKRTVYRGIGLIFRIGSKCIISILCFFVLDKLEFKSNHQRAFVGEKNYILYSKVLSIK